MTLFRSSGTEELHLRFWEWFNYWGNDSGKVKVRFQDGEGSCAPCYRVRSELGKADQLLAWVRRDIDITHLAATTPQVSQLCFAHVAASR